MEPRRAARLAETLREELHELINLELADPRVGAVDVVAVEVSPDGKKAIVRVQAADDEVDLNESVAALMHAKPFLKRSLVQDLDLARVPDLYFEAASEVGPPKRIENLLKRARRGRARETGTLDVKPRDASPQGEPSPR